MKVCVLIDESFEICFKRSGVSCVFRERAKFFQSLAEFSDVSDLRKITFLLWIGCEETIQCGDSFESTVELHDFTLHHVLAVETLLVDFSLVEVCVCADHLVDVLHSKTLEIGYVLVLLQVY